MKKPCLIIGILLVQVMALRADSPFNPQHMSTRNYISQTYMMTRPIYQQVADEQSLWHNVVYYKQGAIRSALQMTAFYGNSSYLERSSYYFMPFCSNEAIVAGDDFDGLRDIRAEWLQLPSDFKGYLSMRPWQRQASVLLQYNQDLKKLFHITFLSDYWVEVYAPIVYMENDLNLRQTISHYPTCTSNPNGPCTIYESFRNPNWFYLKICGKKRTVQLAEVRLRAGKAYIAKDGFELIYFSGLSIPTSKGLDPCYMFSPVTGFNGHLGMELGFFSQVLLSRDDHPYAFSLFVGLDSVFLFDREQYRTFDLIGKPWSRYLLFNQRHGPPNQNIPGVNVMTRKVKVHPYNVIDFACGGRIKTRCYEWEIGYGLWGHGKEKIEFTRQCYDERFGCKSCCMFEGCTQCAQGNTSMCRPCHRNLCECTESEFGIAGNGPLDPEADLWEASTACRSTIGFRAANDAAFEGIKDSDYDLYSGAARSAVVNQVYASVGRLWDEGEIEGFMGAGFFVDLPLKNSALEMWGFWLKGGANF